MPHAQMAGKTRDCRPWPSIKSEAGDVPVFNANELNEFIGWIDG